MIEPRWDIPDSWQWTRAAEIAQIVGGGTPESFDETNFAEHGIPWITPADLTGYEGTHISRGRRDLSEKGYLTSGAQILPSGTVLFSSRAPIGYCVIAANELSTNQGFRSLVLRGDISPEYVRYYLLQSKFYAISLASGTTFPELSGSRVGEISVPVAPLSEQKRIAAKIERLIARINRARTELLPVVSLVEEYKGRLLEIAMSGTLTSQWRKENKAAEWRHLKIDDVANSIFDGPFGSSLKSADYSRSGVRVVRLENIGYLRFIREKETFIPEEAFERLSRHELLPEDIVFSSFLSEGVRVCLIPGDLPTKAINKADCFCVRVNSASCIPKFLALRLACPSAYDVLKKNVHGATRPRISLGHLRAFEFDLPSMDEQAEIVQRAESAFRWLDNMTAENTNAFELLAKLESAILLKAFRGELVPQDRNDEPASAMLERLKAGPPLQVDIGRKRSLRVKSIKTEKKLEKTLEVVLADAGDWLPAQIAFQRCGYRDGASTQDVESFYAQLRQLDVTARLEVEAVIDHVGKKVCDRIRLRAL